MAAEKLRRVQLRARRTLDCSRRAQRCTTSISRLGLNSLKRAVKMQVVMVTLGEKEDEKEAKGKNVGESSISEHFPKRFPNRILKSQYLLTR